MTTSQETYNQKLVYCKFGNFRENLFSRTGLKDILATFKIHDLDMIYLNH